MIVGHPVSVSVTGANPGNATATVQAGQVEFSPAPGSSLISANVEGATVRIFNNTPATGVSFGSPTVYTFSLSDPVPLSITGASGVASGVAGFSPGSVSFTPNSVSFAATGTSWQGGASVTIALKTSCLDVDGNGIDDALTDGLLILRRLFGLGSDAVFAAIVGPGATRTAAQIGAYVDAIGALLDFDDNHQVDAKTDGLLLVRYLFGLRGDALVNGALGEGAQRTTSGIESYIQSLLESPRNQGPQVGAGANQPVTLPVPAILAGTAVDDGLPGPPAALTTEWSKFSGPGSVAFGDANLLATTATFGSAGIYVLRLSASDGALSAFSDVTITVSAADVPPPDPATVAPPVDSTVATNLFDSTAFLYSGPGPIQTGVAPGTIVVQRVAVLRGRVLDRSGAPIPAVRLTIRDHPEFGQTLSRLDGRFDLAVNGGGLLTLDYTKNGLLPVQRQKAVPWQDFAVVDDVVMIPLDPQVTPVAMGGATMQVARGSIQSDASGSRRGTVLFPAGTIAGLVQPDGSLVPAANLNVRLTEYTVGTTGPAAMPGELPATSGYTYAIELGVDEAVAKVNGRDVVFNQPVVFYVENFLNFPAGTVVPIGYYDRDKAAWIPSENGKVIKILSLTGGMADVDSNGDGIIDNPATLAALNITDAERQQLAALYAAGQSLWRMQTPHFSTWDHNWPFGLPDDAQKPDRPKPKPDPHFKGPCEDSGSVINCQSQSLGERIPVTGTRFELGYASDRTPGRKAAFKLDISLSGPAVPPSLKQIDLSVAIAGRQFAATFSSAPNQLYTFDWDGMDAYGRVLEGGATALVRIGYVYDGVYQQTTRFGYNGNGIPITGDKARQEVTIWQDSRTTLGVMRGQIAGWSLSAHHRYDPVARILYKGDGKRQDDQDSLGAFIGTIAGTGAAGFAGDGGPAKQATISSPSALAMSPDGSWYVSDITTYRVRKVGADGIITKVAGTDTSGYSGDGGPATSAQLSNPLGLAVGNDGSLYIGDFARVRRVAPNGIITTFAGNGSGTTSGDGGPATQAGIRSNGALYLAMGPDGSLYISGVDRVRRVAPDGIISTVAGTVSGSSSGDGGLATNAVIKGGPITVGPDGSLYLCDLHAIRRVDPNTGIIRTIAGASLSQGYSGDGGLATLAKLSGPGGLVVGNDGSLFIADGGNKRIRRISPEGIITTIAGSGTSFAFPDGTYGDGGLALQARTTVSGGIVGAPDGSLYVGDITNRRVRRIGSPLPGLAAADLLIAASDGSEVYGFSPNGRHLRTVAALSGVVKYLFGYDGQGRLTSVTDRNGNVTTIARDGTGNPTAITAPGGQVTTLTTANGFLATIANPAGETTQFTYSPGGLMLTETSPTGGLHQFTYDGLGRLTADHGPAGSVKSLARVENSDGHTVTMTTAMGRVTAFQVQELTTGVMRRLNTDATGAVTEALTSPDGTEIINLPTGETISLTAGPDPRFGMQAPRLTKMVRTLPGAGAPVHTTTATRTATLSDPANLFSLTLLTDTVSVNGNVHTRSYNGTTRTMTATSAEARKIVSVLDSKGRLVSQTLATGLSPLQYTYDATGRVIEKRQGSQFWTLGYDALNRLTSRTDAAGKTVGYGYDNAGRLIQQTLPSGIVYQFAYDLNGNRTSVIMPSGAAHALGYTADDDESAYTPPGNASYARTFDADGRLTHSTLPGGRVADQTYDAAGRPLSISFPEAVIGFDYFAADLTDRVKQITSTPVAGAAQNIAYTYKGALVAGMVATGAAPATTTYAYNNDLLPTAMNLVSGADNVTSALTWDKDGMGTGFGPFTLARLGPGGALSKISDASLNMNYTYDTLARITTRNSVFGGVTPYAFQLTYDSAGRVSSRTETLAGIAHTHAYTYDPDGQLTQVQRDGIVTEVYAYDVNGNRTNRTIGGGAAETAVYDAQDRMTQRGGTSYQFSADGFLAQRGPDTFQYSTRGRLLQAVVGGQTITFAYDGLGRRVSRTEGANTDRYVYGDPASHLITAVRNPAGQLTTLYYDTAGLLFALERAGVRYYVATDQTGTPRVVSDNTGAAVKVLEFDTLGNPLGDSNPAFDLPIGFAGGLADAVTGLVHFGLRDYEPAAGRWTTRDPALFSAGQGNLYVYVGNNPVGNRDPSGLICVSVTVYGGYGGGVQTCIGLDGASICLEVGLGAGGGIGVDLGNLNVGNPAGAGPGVDSTVTPALFSGDLDKTGVTEGAELSLECGPVEVGVGATLTMEGCLSAGGKGGLEFHKGEGAHLAELFKSKCSLEGKVYAKACKSEKF